MLVAVEGFEDEAGEFKEPGKLRFRGSWEDGVDDEGVAAPAIPDEEDDLEGAGVRLGS